MPSVLVRPMKATQKSLRRAGRTATESGDEKYAGHRLSFARPFDGLTQETRDRCLRPGEVRQLPPDDEKCVPGSQAPHRSVRRGTIVEDPDDGTSFGTPAVSKVVDATLRATMEFNCKNRC